MKTYKEYLNANSDNTKDASTEKIRIMMWEKKG